MAYIEQSKKPEGCVFCLEGGTPLDEEKLVVHRGARAFVIMNLYPYNPGHVLVAPFAHVSTLGDLPEEALTELMALTRESTEVMGRVMAPEGFNVGMNLGRVAGAGVADHLHIHVVPRWGGDTNYMPVVAGTRVLPEDLPTTYRKLRAAWEAKT
jgi:ATP adenylyltransferase